MIKLFRSTLQERSNYSRESRLARNRQVSKIHERLARDAHKAQDDDKGRRMDALKVSLAPLQCQSCEPESPSGCCKSLKRPIPILLRRADGCSRHRI